MKRKARIGEPGKGGRIKIDRSDEIACIKKTRKRKEDRRENKEITVLAAWRRVA